MRLLSVTAVVSVALVGVACPDEGTRGPSRVPAPSALDLSLLAPAVVLQPYSAPVRITGYTGEAIFQVTSGVLPPGLSMRPGGTVQGRPTSLGSWTFEVLAVPERFDPIRGDVTLEVVLGNTELRLGVARERSTTVREESDLLWAPWVRVAAPQLQDRPDLTRVALLPGLYAAGQNGRFERGAGDDVRLVDLPVEEFEVTLGDWEVPAGVWGPCEDDPPADEACAEGEPLQYADGEFLAGSDTGTRQVEISHSAHGVLRFEVLALPPDWCPDGSHYGGWQTRGSCE